MESASLLQDAVRILEAQKQQGRQRVFLNAATRAALFADVAAPAAGTVPAPVTAGAPLPVVPAAVSGTSATAPAPAPVWPSAEAATPEVRETQSMDSYDIATLPGIVAACQRCALHAAGRRQTVFSDGSPQAALMFIGEGPGEEEDIQGKPFVGRAGQLLTKMIEAMHLRREDVYICNIVKCRPPQNRVPAEEEAKACLPYLERQIALVHPKWIVVLGATPLLHLLGMKGITALHGKWQEYRGIPVMPTYHPAYLLRVPTKKRETWDDLKLVMAKMGLQP